MKGRKAEVINKNSPHYGKKVVIQWETKSGLSYYVRNLERRPMIERFGYGQDGKVRLVTSTYETFRVAKKSVKLIGGKADPMINTWQKETIRILEENKGLTRTQIRRKYG